jgi:hypothetical protein
MRTIVMAPMLISSLVGGARVLVQQPEEGGAGGVKGSSRISKKEVLGP